MKIFVKVIPNASKDEQVAAEGNVLKIRLKASPEKGKANQALISFLAKEYGVAPSSIKIIKGKTNRNKIVEIDTSHLNSREGRRS